MTTATLRHEYGHATADLERAIERLERALRVADGDAALREATRLAIDDARRVARRLRWLRDRCGLDLFPAVGDGPR